MTYKFHLNADLQAVWLRLAGKFNAPLAQLEEFAIRTRRNGVRGVDGAPQEEEGE